MRRQKAFFARSISCSKTSLTLLEIPDVFSSSQQTNSKYRFSAKQSKTTTHSSQLNGCKSTLPIPNCFLTDKPSLSWYSLGINRMSHNLSLYRFVKMFGPSGVTSVLGAHWCTPVGLVLRADRCSSGWPITVLVWKSCWRFIFVFVCHREMSDTVFVVKTIISEVGNNLVDQIQNLYVQSRWSVKDKE